MVKGEFRVLFVCFPHPIAVSALASAFCAVVFIVPFFFKKESRTVGMIASREQIPEDSG